MYTGFWFKSCLSHYSSIYRGLIMTVLKRWWKFKSPICHSEGTNVTVRIKRSEMRLRLDSYVATMLLLWMTKGWGHPHPNGIMTIGIFEYSITQTKFGYHRAICTISSQRDIIAKGDIIVISLRRSRNIVYKCRLSMIRVLILKNLLKKSIVRYAQQASAYVYAHDCTYYTFYVLYSDYHA